MKIDIVFSGGGVKAFAFIGALKSIERHGLSITRTAGTSAGAIISSLITANYTSEEIAEKLSYLNLQQLLDPPKITTLLPVTKWYYLFFKMGFYKGNKLEQWLAEVFARKNIHTFSDIKEGSLKVVVSDLSLKRLIVIPYDLREVYGIDPKDFSVAKAIRISAGFPLFFMPQTILGKNNQESLLVDGGIVSNFPIWLYKNNRGKSKRPVLGVKLSGQNEETKIKNAAEMIQALLLTMKQSHDEHYIHKYLNDIIFIPVQDIETMNLSIDHTTKLQMINQGEEITNTFLHKWPT